MLRSPNQRDIPFFKYSGSGNDFILIDNRERRTPPFTKEFIQRLTHRQMGVGADGVILLEYSTHADVKMRIFNADGSEAEMCGNGIRCLLRFMTDLGFPRRSYRIETMERVLFGSFEGKLITIDMNPPTEMKWNISLKALNSDYIAHHLNTGVPHAVIFVQDVSKIDIAVLGHAIRHHDYFSPKGANANFVEILEPNFLKIRTFERGVEGETLSCGTGCTASALAHAKLSGIKEPIRLITASGEELLISFDNEFRTVKMSGPAHQTFKGFFHDATV